MFKRPYFQTLTKRLKEPKKFIQVITGPRQVGKTTLVHQVLKEIQTPSMYISADGVINIGPEWIEQQWNNARLKLKTSNFSELIFVIDEVQKIPDWSEMVKANWDSDMLNGLEIKLVLLGSSRLLIQKGLTESLAGRFEVIYTGHWNFEEMNQAFGITEEQFVWFGGYPGAAGLINDELRWNDYIINSLIETTISRDILLMENINKPALLRNLFELGCSYSGQILSFTKILGQLQDAGNTTTLSHYLHLLDSAGLLSGLQKFTKVKITKRSSSPKFQVQNTAFYSALSDYQFSDVVGNAEIWGRHVESAIGAHLFSAARANNLELSYWREGNFEVDFILQYKNKVVGIEVKIGSAKFTKGMQRFSSHFKPHKMYLISNEGLNWKGILKINPVDLF
ncbi:MAG: ATP-binding protein [Mariniphaga sp.]|nr:ATP-binding protein [Mariniphaga sp.]